MCIYKYLIYVGILKGANVKLIVFISGKIFFFNKKNTDNPSCHPEQTAQ